MALPHLIHDGDNGYLFEPDDVEQFAEKLLRIATADRKELDRLSENSLHLIQSHDIKRTVAIFEGLYRGDSGARVNSDDNSEEYLRPIGRLSAAVRKAEKRMREQTLKALAEFGDEIKEGLDEIRSQAKKVDKRMRKSVQKTVGKAKKTIKRKDK